MLFLRWTSFLLALLISISSCRKEKTSPPSNNNPVPKPSEIFIPTQTILKPYGPLVLFDFNRDRNPEIIFYTQLVGDPLYQEDKLQFRIKSNLSTALAVNSNEQMPRWTYGVAIPSDRQFGNYTYYVAADLMLMQEVTPMLPRQVYWMGDWQQDTIAYIGFVWNSSSGPRRGWIAIRAEKEEKQMRVIRAGLFPVSATQTLAGY